MDALEPPVTIVVCVAEEITREFIVDNLCGDGRTAVGAATAEQAIGIAKRVGAALVICDLPDPSEIREGIGPDTPIVALLGGDWTDRVKALAGGASECLLKPFSYSELAMRVAAVLHRGGALRVGALVIDPATRKVWVGERRVELSNTEFALLHHLARRPTRVFTKEELLRDVWGFRSLGRTRTLDSHASRLRRKLDPEARRYVFNCWGVGYRLVTG